MVDCSKKRPHKQKGSQQSDDRSKVNLAYAQVGRCIGYRVGDAEKVVARPLSVDEELKEAKFSHGARFKVQSGRQGLQRAID